MTKTRRALPALAVTLAALCWTAQASAADSLSFGDQGQTATSHANDIVRIDGTISYETRCPKPGIPDFFYPATDVYIVGAGQESGALHDASGGGGGARLSEAAARRDEEGA